MSASPPILIGEALRAELRALGIRPGGCLIVHSSMKALNRWIPGGAETLTRSLLAVLGPEGTLVLPTHTPENTEPSNWSNPPVPREWWEDIRAHMPPFVPETSITRAMGALPEFARRFPGARRSDHPIVSFTAIGAQAERIVARHELADFFGDASPLGALYELGGEVLLLGVGHDSNTSLHLAEVRADWPGKERLVTIESCAALVEGQRRWLTFERLEVSDDDFPALGAAFEASIGYEPGRVGDATTRLLPIRGLVDFGVRWLSAHRKS